MGIWRRLPARGHLLSCLLTFLKRFTWLGQVPVQCADGDVPPSRPAIACVAGPLALELVQHEVAILLHHSHSIITGLNSCEMLMADLQPGPQGNVAHHYWAPE